MPPDGIVPQSVMEPLGEGTTEDDEVRALGSARWLAIGSTLLPHAKVLGLGAAVLAVGFVLGTRRPRRRQRVMFKPAPPRVLRVETADRRALLPPPGRQGLLALGREAARRGRADEAVGWFDAATRLYPSSIDAHRELARGLVAMRRYDEAVEELLDALKLAPEAHELRYELARTFGAAGRSREAVDELARLVQRSPQITARIERDDAFATLADHPMFLAIIGRV
jgi:tetratricopeptide (TPR) repeat protein